MIRISGNIQRTRNEIAPVSLPLTRRLWQEMEGPYIGDNDLSVVRASYNQDVARIEEVVAEMDETNLSIDFIATQSHGLRRQIGHRYKRSSDLGFRNAIYWRNVKKYGDPLGPTLQYLIKNGKSWTEIIKSSMRTNRAINQASVKGQEEIFQTLLKTEEE